MVVLKDLLLDRVGLSPLRVEHLQRLLADWQILADLSFADLLLFVRHDARERAPVPDTATQPPVAAGAGPSYLCVGQMRPYTAQTIYTEDMVGRSLPAAERPMVGRAFAEQRVIRDTDPDWSTGVPVREEAIPVRLRGEEDGVTVDEVIAVITREANVSTARSPSQLELTYLQSAGELAQMLADGTFPYAGDNPDERELSPRVGDGVMRLDAHGKVTYASPNAISAYRRLGRLDHLVGQHLAAFDPAHEDFADALADGIPIETEVERQGAVVLRRLLPLIGTGKVIGGLLLVREVTELRRHERALRIKDATIREIHHRVKNNLQTVASLLRLQARRLKTPEARAALAESVRRITSIALVHETLSQESRQRVDFDKIAQRIVDMLGDGLTDPESPIEFQLDGVPGELPAEVATPLALVLAELLQNSLEHAYPAGSGGGTVRVHFERGPATLRVVVSDEGVGLPPGATLESVANLGLQIVRTLVESELGGRIASLADGGTTVELTLPLP